MTARRVLTLFLFLVMVSVAAFGANLVITPATISGGTVGNVVNIQFQAANATATPITWGFTGTLPAGLSLNTASGVLSGQYTTATLVSSPYLFAITATTASDFGTQNYSVAVAAGPTTPSIDTSAFVPKASVGTAFSSKLGGTGGKPPYTFTLPQGSVNGLNVATDGTVSGTPTVAGVANLPVNIKDSLGAQNGGQITVNVIGVITTNLPNGSIGTLYSQTLTAGGVVGGATWALADGTTPPPGLVLSSAGVLSGTPTTNGSFPFNVTVTDGTQNSALGTVTVVIGASSGLAITTTSPITPGVINVAYTFPLAATSGTAPLTWTLSSTTPLPPGLSLSSAGVISGTPTATGTTSFTVTVKDAQNFTATKSLQIVIAATAPTLTITTTSPLSPGSVGSGYTQALNATGGTNPYSWALTTGSLPPGLNLAATGIISGIPTSATTSNFGVTVTDSASPAHTATANFSLTVNAATLVITTTSPLPPGPTNFAYSATVQAAGGTTPYTWSASGLPAGLSIGSATGIISGTPTTAGTTTAFITVTDVNRATANASLNIVITTPTLTVTGVTASCFPAYKGRQFPDTQIPVAASCPANNVYQFTATGSASPTPTYSFRLAVPGSLPPGLNLTGTGVVNGTPTAAGTYPFTVIATDNLQAQGATTATIVVNTVPVVGAPSSVTITLGGSTGPAIAANTQPAVVVSIGQTFPFPVNGKVTLGFVSSVGGLNTLVTFAGGPTATFRIPAGVQTANVGQILTGTQAGVITLSATQFTDDFGNDMTPLNPATVSYNVAADVPVILSVGVTNSTASGFTLTVTGYSTTRDMTSATFNFTAATGVTLTAASATVPLTGAFQTWYSDPRSNPFGSAFSFTIPFTFSNGNTKPITGVTTTLTNSKGTSALFPTTGVTAIP